MTALRHTLLLVDDEAAVRFGIGDFLTLRGYAVREAVSAAEAVESVSVVRPDAVIIDYALPDGNALDVIPRLREIDPGLFIVLLTAHGSIELAVETIKAGADQFLTKPVNLETLQVVLERGLEARRHRQREAAHERLEARQGLQPFLGDSPAVRAFERAARKLAASGSPVLLLGETGTGKRELARWLHDSSPRTAEAFVDLNCAGLSREALLAELFGYEARTFPGTDAPRAGLLEMADRGTACLDEIGDVDPQVQPLLLQVFVDRRCRRLGGVRERGVDIRLIAATRHDLGRMERENKFCAELFFRIGTIPLPVPPLRERRQDIPVLAEALIEKLAYDFGRRRLALTPGALRVLQAYDWPGNLRELRNVLERAVLLSEHSHIDASDLRSLAPAPSAAAKPRTLAPAASRVHS